MFVPGLPLNGNHLQGSQSLCSSDQHGSKFHDIGLNSDLCLQSTLAPRGESSHGIKVSPIYFTSMSVEVEVLLARSHLYHHSGVLQICRNPPSGSRRWQLTVTNKSKHQMIHASSVLPVKCLNDSVV